MGEFKNGTAFYCQITGVLGRSEESSPRFMVTGKGYEFSSSGGCITKTPVNEVCIDVDLRSENLRLENIPLGTTVTWAELRGQGKGNYLHNCSIRVVPPRRKAAKQKEPRS